MNKMTSPKVTIVTVTFNIIKNGREKFFRQCIESVHNQTYKNIEHLIIDGASSDGTVNLIKEYADKGWVKYISEPDKGMCDAMNKGIRMAKGEYVAILNSDDYYTENAIELSVDALKRENADFSYADTDMRCRESLELKNVWLASDYTYAYLYIYMPFNHETMLCKKSIYEKLNYYNWEVYDTIADFDFVQRLILNDYKGVYVQHSILQFRLDGTTNHSDDNAGSATYYKHISYMYKLYFELWSQFLPTDIINELQSFGNKKEWLTPTEIIALQQERITSYFIKFLAEKQLKNYKWNTLFQSVIYRQNIPDNKAIRKTVKLFDVLPILKIKQRKGKTVYRLFNFLPIIVKKQKEGKIRYRLFGFIPLLKIKEVAK